MAFQLKLADYDLSKRFASIDFSQDAASGGLFNPVFDSTFGDTIEYGKLFAYLFRRFGYPNSGWDDYKQLTSYELTTPHPDLLLGIAPHVSDSVSLTFTFFAGLNQRNAVRDWEDRPRGEWTARVDVRVGRILRGTKGSIRLADHVARNGPIHSLRVAVIERCRVEGANEREEILGFVLQRLCSG